MSENSKMKQRDRLVAEASHEAIGQAINQRDMHTPDENKTQNGKDYKKGLVELLNGAMQQAKYGHFPEK